MRAVEVDERGQRQRRRRSRSCARAAPRAALRIGFASCLNCRHRTPSEVARKWSISREDLHGRLPRSAGSAPARSSRARRRAGRPRPRRAAGRRTAAARARAARRRARAPPSGRTPRRPEQEERRSAPKTTMPGEVAEDADAGRGRLLRVAHLARLQLLVELAGDGAVAVERCGAEEREPGRVDEVAATGAVEDAGRRLLLVAAPAPAADESRRRSARRGRRTSAPWRARRRASRAPSRPRPRCRGRGSPARGARARSRRGRARAGSAGPCRTAARRSCAGRRLCPGSPRGRPARP